MNFFWKEIVDMIISRDTKFREKIIYVINWEKWEVWKLFKRSEKIVDRISILFQPSNQANNESENSLFLSFPLLMQNPNKQPNGPKIRATHFRLQITPCHMIIEIFINSSFQWWYSSKFQHSLHDKINAYELFRNWFL